MSGPRSPGLLGRRSPTPSHRHPETTGDQISINNSLRGTPSPALYVLWAGRAGPYLDLSVWLWPGVLDAIRGVNFGVILLQTLSRGAHSSCISWTLGTAALCFPQRAFLSDIVAQGKCELQGGCNNLGKTPCECLTGLEVWLVVYYIT